MSNTYIYRRLIIKFAFFLISLSIEFELKMRKFVITFFIYGFANAVKRETVQIAGTTIGPNFVRQEAKSLAINCPLSHPYAYANGDKCCKTPWKYTSGSQADCDGFMIGLRSRCCPEELSKECVDQSGNFRKCKNYVTSLSNFIFNILYYN